MDVKSKQRRGVYNINIIMLFDKNNYVSIVVIINN